MNPASLTGLALVIALLLPAIGAGDPKPGTLRIPNPKAWVGQRVPFLVELRAPGSFDGAASFSIPQIPRTVIVKVGNPVVSSEEIDDDTWFVQTHEFALFSQKSGTVEIPAFEARFRHHKGFTGPVFDQKANVSSGTIEIQRPPGSDEGDFLITTKSLDVSETWVPQPGSTEQGAVFHRTISQQAEQVTAIALAPPPEEVPHGVRVYLDPPEVSDDTARGAFTGKRKDTITYVMREAGTWTLPAIKYVWWDPDKQQFGSRTLPAVTFVVAPAPSEVADNQAAESNLAWRYWVVGGLILIGIAMWQRRRIVTGCRAIWARWNPPAKVAARELLRACRQDDAKAAEAAWIRWRGTRSADFDPDPALRTAVLEMQRSLFGPAGAISWHGRCLEAAFREHLTSARLPLHTERSVLPDLNPSAR